MAKFPLETIRHSAAHVLAQAVKKYCKNVKLAIGPSIDNGFYYDFELDEPIKDSDLENIEKEMVKIINQGQEFSQYNLSSKEAKEFFEKSNEVYKVELIEDLDVESVSIYKNGPFIDLCKGPHVKNTQQIGVIKLLRVSGAYWRGSEKNNMLQRIYGTAFHTQKELKAYLKMLEEAKERDHRKIGKELKLFTIQDDIGGGLVMWLPKGAAIRQIIEDLWRKEHQANGYDIVYSPHIGKGDLWDKSGHIEFYKENMFAEMDIDNVSYYLKPMNCPFHIAMYKQHQLSYKDLPIRYAELGTVYRYERSGVLHGLMRVRGFTQDDAHIFCTEEQVKDEIVLALGFSLSMLKIFGFDDIKICLSTKPADKYVGKDNDWKVAEKSLQDALEFKGIDFEIDEGGGAFYGPKIDIKIKDSIGREWQCSTIQFDFNLPLRFDMSYINTKGEKQQPYMIHRALLGSIERFFGIMIEHYAGKFPTWLSPIQIRFIFLISDGVSFEEEIIDCCKQHNIRYDFDRSNEKLGYKVRKAQLEKIPLIGIIGRTELEQRKITVRLRDSKKQSILSIKDIVKDILNKNI